MGRIFADALRCRVRGSVEKAGVDEFDQWKFMHWGGTLKRVFELGGDVFNPFIQDTHKFVARHRDLHKRPILPLIPGALPGSINNFNQIANLSQLRRYGNIQVFTVTKKRIYTA